MAGSGSRKGGAGRGAGGKTLAERKHANAVAKGVRVPYTDTDRRRVEQLIATAQRKVDEYRRRPPRNAFGLDRNAILQAESNLRNLQEGRQAMAKPGAWRRASRLTQYLAGKDRLSARRVARRNREFFADLDAIRQSTGR